MRRLTFRWRWQRLFDFNRLGRYFSFLLILLGTVWIALGFVGHFPFLDSIASYVDPLGDLQLSRALGDGLTLLFVLYLALVFLSIPLIFLAYVLTSVFTGVPLSKLLRTAYDAPGFPSVLSGLMKMWKKFILGMFWFVFAQQLMLPFIVNSVLALLIGLFSYGLWSALFPIIRHGISAGFTPLLAFFSVGGYLVVWGYFRLRPIPSNFSYLTNVPLLTGFAPARKKRGT